MGDGKTKTAKEKLARYCALQERSQQQARNKLSDYGVFGDEAEEIIAELISLDFINEERFASAYVRGKFRIKNWGRIKIQQGLFHHKISEYCLKKGFEEIDDKEYLETLTQLLKKYIRTLKEKDNWQRKNKASRYLISKGYEPFLVYDVVNEFL